MNCSVSSRSSALGSRADQSARRDGRCDCIVARARCRALLAAASYLRRPGDSRFRAFKLDVLRVHARRIAEITTFNAELFGQFGLPAVLQA